MFYRGVTDLYAFYNIGVDPLPPPPNPNLVKAFHYACALIIAEQEQEANGAAQPKQNKYPGFAPPN